MTKRYAAVEQQRCIACGACTNTCPRTAITIWKGCYAVVDIQQCVGCGQCERICPANSIQTKETNNETTKEMV